MQWLVVVLFATLQGDMYIFTTPEFETRDECMATVLDPKHIKGYTQKLLLEYGELPPIQAVNCLQSDTLNRILNQGRQV